VGQHGQSAESLDQIAARHWCMELSSRKCVEFA
jgi:hypothetical protein